MSSSSDPHSDSDRPRLSPVERADRLRGVSLWLSQLDRAVRNCLLYGGQGAAVARVRAQLAESLLQLLRRFEPLVIRITAESVEIENEAVLVEPSVREGLIALLHRDGVRGLTVRLGVEKAEVDALLDAIVRTSGPDTGDADLVTALWEAELPHIEVDAAPLEADFVSGAEGDDEGGESFLPWPAGTGAGGVPTVSGAEPGGPGGQESGPSRSDDWQEAASTEPPPEVAAEAAPDPPPEVERLRADYDAEQSRPVLAAALETARACLATIAHGERIQELRQFLLRAIRQAVQIGDWAAASEAVGLAAPPGSPPESRGEIGRRVLGAISLPEVVRILDRQPLDSVNRFVAWAGELGDAAAEWLFHAMAESQERRNRRLFAQSLAEACRHDCAVLAPWMSDPRWYVVRNLVFVLGQIGGDAIAPLVQQACAHPERRVRRQCLVALGTMSPSASRPILLGLLREPDPDLFHGALALLGARREPASARGILEFLIAPEVAHRPESERTALAAAAGAAGGEAILPWLEQLFARDHWICRQPATCRALVTAVARTGAEATSAFLERGLRSRHGAVRAACAAAREDLKNAA